jgi:hypothetical protein
MRSGNCPWPQKSTCHPRPASCSATYRSCQSHSVSVVLTVFASVRGRPATSADVHRNLTEIRQLSCAVHHRSVSKRLRPLVGTCPAEPQPSLPTSLLCGFWLWQSDEVEDFPGRVAFEAPDDFAPGLALLDPALVVVLRARVDPQTGEHDSVECGVGLTVTAAVETAELPASRGTLDRTDPAQRSEGRLTVQAFRSDPPYQRLYRHRAAGPSGRSGREEGRRRTAGRHEVRRGLLPHDGEYLRCDQKEVQGRSPWRGC